MPIQQPTTEPVPKLVFSSVISAPRARIAAALWRGWLCRGQAWVGIFAIAALSGAALSGCSRKSGESQTSAINLVKAGEDSTWAQGYVLNVAKREGNALEGIRVLKTSSDGSERTIVAEKGTISPGADKDSVKITLYEAETLNGNNRLHAHLLTMVFTK
jgi:hypothetical protein